MFMVQILYYTPWWNQLCELYQSQCSKVIWKEKTHWLLLFGMLWNKKIPSILLDPVEYCKKWQLIWAKVTVYDSILEWDGLRSSLDNLTREENDHRRRAGPRIPRNWYSFEAKIESIIISTQFEIGNDLQQCKLNTDGMRGRGFREIDTLAKRRSNR